MTSADRIRCIREEIRALSPHPERVRLIAVSKKQDLGRMRKAAEAGIRDFGENRIQEAADKFSQEAFPGITRHFIGYLQSNKVNKCLQNFNWLHSLQTEKLAGLIAHSEIPLLCLIEVNISGESSKSGIRPEALRTFVKGLSACPGLQVRGLMGIAPLTEDENTVRRAFALLRELALDCRSPETEDLHFDELSMGMSGDYCIALQEGATMLRIGTAIFGPRQS